MKHEEVAKRCAFGMAIACGILAFVLVVASQTYEGAMQAPTGATEKAVLVSPGVAEIEAQSTDLLENDVDSNRSASNDAVPTDEAMQLDEVTFEDGVDASAVGIVGVDREEDLPNREDVEPREEEMATDDREASDVSEPLFTLPDDVACEPDVVLVGVDEALGVDDVAQRLSSAGDLDAVGVTEVIPGVMQVAFAQDAASLEDEVNSLLSLPFIEYAQPNYVYESADSDEVDAEVELAPETVDDDESIEKTDAGEGDAANEEGLENNDDVALVATSEEVVTTQGDEVFAESAADAPLSNDTNARLQWNLRSVNVKGAWDAGFDGSGVSVAVIDAGFDMSHPDLRGRIVGARNVLDGSTNMQGNSHGSQVSGVLVSTRNNAFGIAGVAPGARVVPVLASYDSQYTTENLLKAYAYIMSVRQQYNIKVINTSFGFDWSHPSATDLLMYRKIDEAFAAGVVSVASAGNGQGPYCHCPCDYGTTVGVTGLYHPGFDPNTYAKYNADVVAFSPISNFNGLGETSKNICAPGWDVPNLSFDDYGQSAYWISGGTSFAAPHVAGTLALMFGANPSLSATQAISALYGSAHDMGDAGWDRFFGYGEVDATKAVEFARKGVWLEGPRWLAAGSEVSYACGSGARISSLACSNAGVAQVSETGARAKVRALRSGVAQFKGSSSNGDVLQADAFVVGPVEGTSSLGVDNSARFSVSQPYPFAYRWTLDGVALATGSSATVTATSVGKHTLVATLIADPSVRLQKQLTFTAKDVARTQVDAVASQVYTGAQICPKPVVRSGSKRLAEGADYALSYANNVQAGTATITVAGRGNYTGTMRVTFEIVRAAHVRYCSHVQNVGWQDWKSDGAMSGTSGKSLRLEGLKIELTGAPFSGGVEYRTHVQNVGWQDWKANGAMSGTSGKSLRLEALELRLTGDMAAHYDVWYRVHAQDYGWLGWTSNGGPSGTATLSKRLEALEVRILPKGSAAPGSVAQAYVTRRVAYSTHVQNVGWQEVCCDGRTGGTTGKSLRLEGIKLSLPDKRVAGSIEYCTHVQDYGWQGYVRDGRVSGTSGKSKRLEAIRIRLAGAIAEKYDVWYRVHAQNIGWMGWAKNDQRAGTQGFSYRLEGIQVKLLPKGSSAPGSTSESFRENMALT